MKAPRKTRAEVKSKRLAHRTRKMAAGAGHVLQNSAPVNASLLAPSNSYSTPEFVERGYYINLAFTCKDCGKREIWSSTQQKWWYEVAKGDRFTMATRCRPCRKTEQARQAHARHVHLTGLAAKRART